MTKKEKQGFFKVPGSLLNVFKVPGSLLNVHTSYATVVYVAMQYICKC